MMTRTASFVIVAALALSSCGRQEAPADRTIGVSLQTRAHVFYRDLEEGLLGEAKNQRYELIITAGEFDLGRQMAQVEDFIARKVDAIILVPVDSKGVGPAVRKANEAGIPVFTADIAAQEGTVVSHIASDNIAGGRLAGEFIGNALGGTGQVAIINQPNVSSVLDRVQGFREAVSQFAGIRIVADVNGEGVRDKAFTVTADVLQAHPGITGIFGINDDSALGALDAVTQYKKDGIVIVGYDATPPAADAIRKGTPLKADVVQYPKLIGTKTILQIRKHFDGGEVEKLVPVEVGIVDRAALDQAPPVSETP